jgi:hypothetical protein
MSATAAGDAGARDSTAAELEGRPFRLVDMGILFLCFALALTAARALFDFSWESRIWDAIPQSPYMSMASGFNLAKVVLAWFQFTMILVQLFVAPLLYAFTLGVGAMDLMGPRTRTGPGLVPSGRAAAHAVAVMAVVQLWSALLCLMMDETGVWLGARAQFFAIAYFGNTWSVFLTMASASVTLTWLVLGMRGRLVRAPGWVEAWGRFAGWCWVVLLVAQGLCGTVAVLRN